MKKDTKSTTNKGCGANCYVPRQTADKIRAIAFLTRVSASEMIRNELLKIISRKKF